MVLKNRNKHSHPPPNQAEEGLSDPIPEIFEMPPPQKGYKVINHRDVQYRWIMQNRRGVNELVIEASAPVNGQNLIAELPRIVSYDMVTAAIDFGNVNGWKPNESGKPFRCKWERKAFQLAEV